MTISNLSIHRIIEGKTILIIGGSGFISKVWISMLLEYIPKIKKVIILVRSEKGKCGYTRFEEIYANSPVFSNLRNIYGNELSKLKKIEVITGNVCCENFNLPNNILETLQNDVDLAVNFAADLRFFAPLDQMLKSNSESTKIVADFILSTKKAKLLHISTCYVAGMADGIVPEQAIKDISPNGTKFTAEEEIKWGIQEAQAMRSRNASDKELVKIGTVRAERLGWPNTYTYTKGLGEAVLSNKIPTERLSIFRPSIVESAEKYPFPGWNEDFNGTAPFIQMFSTRYRHIVAKPNHNLDIIPVDYVAKGLTIAASALLAGKHSPVYQSSTSSINPLSVALASEYVCNYFRQNQKRSLSQILLPASKPKFITPQHILSGTNINRIEKTVSYLFDKIKLEKNSAKIIAKFGIESTISTIKRKAKTIDTIMKVYKPFIYDYNYTFKSDNLLNHRVTEEEFSYTPTDIKWEKYWNDVHIPGLNQWCLPQLKALTSGKKGNKKVNK
ncbi:SDR family oxidoreductase [Pigmentibacter ruber]|uniref:SDR family oxidoreductase n=1 Tax=Pigmentibacter ruber TaxID=2683196 RepID=UPI00131AE7CE|nr:SDR family oxidoreductase [Pigmentibacter ruber]